MPINPSNCYICKTTWLGPGAICAACRYDLLFPNRPAPSPIQCSFCGGSHDAADCLSAALQQAQQTQYKQAHHSYNYGSTITGRLNMARKAKLYTNYAPPLKHCSACKGNYAIESKAGSVCSNCRVVVHNPCRNCNSSHWQHQKITQFIECQDCLFIE